MGTKYDQLHYDEMDLRIVENSGLLHADAGETVFFARQLEYVRAKTYDVERPALSAWTLFPIDTSVPAGAKTITWRQWDAVGVAKIITSYADDLPHAGIKAMETTSPIKSIGNSYGYDVQEIRHAQLAQVPLDAKLAMAARKANEQLVNRLAWFGDTTTGLPGFLSNTNIPAYVLPADGTGSSKLFSTKTPDQIIRDLNATANLVFTQTNGIHRANELWMPLAQYAYISSTPRSTLSDTTILDFFLANNPFIQRVIPVLELTGAGTAGADMMIAAENSEENYQMNLPLMFMQHAPQPKNLYFEIPCESRFGGVTIERPFAFVSTQGL
jgi:hypothetical protein